MNKTFFLALLIFVGFFSYYNWTSDQLQIGAGPDFESHNDAVRFIYEHKRLAVFPRDEDKLLYSAYGGSRTLRPPFTYIVAALMAHTRDFELRDGHSLSDEARIAFRKGSVLLCSLTLVVGFYALWVVFGSRRVAFSGAIMLGLMPQYAFIASYNNDDSGAIFSATLLLMSLLVIYRRGVSLPRMLLLGAAGGLVILSKQTAWLLAPTVLIILAMFVRMSWRKWLGYGALVGMTALLFGGWWLFWNMAHYGIDDPFLSKLINEVAERHEHFSSAHINGFKAIGVNAGGLLILNHENFWQKTFYSLVGNLDWLRLRVAPVVYWFYGGMLLVALGGYVLTILRLPFAWRRSTPTERRDWGMAGVLVFALGFQFAMYVWANLYNDIQMQGKYLLPVWLAAWILFFNGIAMLRTGYDWGLEKTGFSEYRLPLESSRISGKLTLVLVLAVVLMHFYSLFYYVRPYYRGVIHEIGMQLFMPLTFGRQQIIYTHQLADFKLENGEMSFTSTGNDPYLVFDKSLCHAFKGNRILKLRLWSDVHSQLRVYWMDFNQENRRLGTVGGHNDTLFQTGDQEIYLGVTTPTCDNIRLDFGLKPGHFRVSGIATAVIDIDRTERPSHLPF